MSLLLTPDGVDDDRTGACGSLDAQDLLAMLADEADELQ